LPKWEERMAVAQIMIFDRATGISSLFGSLSAKVPSLKLIGTSRAAQASPT
jgi:hypothetical protein